MEYRIMAESKKTPTTFGIVDGFRVGHGHAGTTVDNKRMETPFDFPALRREDLVPAAWDWYRGFFASVKAASKSLYKGAEYKIGGAQGGKTRDTLVAPDSEATIQRMLNARIVEMAGAGEDVTDIAVATVAAGDDRAPLVELWKAHIRVGEQVKPEDDEE